MIKICIKDAKGNITELRVNQKDIIHEVIDLYCHKIHLNYDFKYMELVYRGRFLKHDKTVGEYKIRDNSYLIFRITGPSIGGEVGAQAKGLTDPTKKGPVKYPTINVGPDYLIVDEGLNLFGICKNEKCIAYHKKVCSIFGFGVFDLIKDLDEISEKCPKWPSCENPLLKLETCVFKRCKYSYNGCKIEDKKLIYVNYNNSISEYDKLDYFAVSIGVNKSVWVDLKIEANPL